MMKTTYLLCISLLFFLVNCGSKKKNIVTPHEDSVQVTNVQDTTEEIVTGDSIRVMTIPPVENYRNKKSPGITQWMKGNLRSATGELDSTPSLVLLKLVDIYPLPENRKYTKGIYYQTKTDTGVYIVGISATCSDSYGYGILILFKFNKATNTLKEFTTFYGDECAGTNNNHGGQYESFGDFGPYFCVRVFHDNSGMSEQSQIIINDNFKEVEWLSRTYSYQYELDQPDQYGEDEREYTYEFKNDTLIQHCHIQARKYKKKKDVKMDVVWKCYPDTILCIDKDALKKRNQLIEQIENW
jgi:hypothetical protein